MFNSPTLSHNSRQYSSIDMMNAKYLLDEKTKTIEQLKAVIDDLKLRHKRKERDLLKRVGILYNDLQQTKKKMAHLICKTQQEKMINDETKLVKDFATQTDHNSLSICINCSTQYKDENVFQLFKQLNIENDDQEQQPKYYTLQPEEEQTAEYISATIQPTFNQSLSSPALSTMDRSSTRSSCSHHHSSISSTKHNESSSSAYNTAESLPSSTYSDEIESLERVLNAASIMYTTHDNLQHTIKLQEELFRQRLRLRGIKLNEDGQNVEVESSSSEHLYDNIDDETSDIEKQPTTRRQNSLPSHLKNVKQNFTFSTDDEEQQRHQQQTKKSKQNRVRFIDQYQSFSKRKNGKSTSKTNLTKLTNNKRNSSSTTTLKKLPVSSNMLTVTIA